jgi:hypothetical protein
VDFLGVLASDHGQAHDRVFVDSDQATGLADTATLLQMLEDREGLVFVELAAIQDAAFAFGEAFLAGAAGEDTTAVVGSVVEGDAEVVQAAAAVVGTLGILAAEGFQVVHRGPSRFQESRKVAMQLESA